MLRVNRPGSGRENSLDDAAFDQERLEGWMGSAVLQAWPAFQTLADPPNNGRNG